MVRVFSPDKKKQEVMCLIEKVPIYDNTFPRSRQDYAVLFVVFLLEFFITAISRFTKLLAPR